MGAEIDAHAPEPTQQESQATLKVALQEAQRCQRLAEQGFFNSPNRTCNIEQEIHCLSRTTGLPMSGAAYVESQPFPGIRFDTLTSIIEYDAGDIVPVEPDSLIYLYDSLLHRTQQMQQVLKAHDTDTIVVPIGVQPLLAGDWQPWTIPNPGLERRYYLIELATRRENPTTGLTIQHPETQEVFSADAAYMTTMTRCAGTQFHISERTVEEALEAYNISILIAPIMIALFGNSPYAGGVDTGRTSSRVALYMQAEPRRSGLPEPAQSLYQYYEQQLTRVLPPFALQDDPEQALTLTHGALHTTSRIQVDLMNGTIRNEFRSIDAQSPFRSMQALLLILGAIDGLRDYPLTAYEETEYNYQSCVWGLHAPMCACGRQTTAWELARTLVTISMSTLREQGLEALAHTFLAPLLDEELRHGNSQADIIRANVKANMSNGGSLQEAIAEAMVSCNYTALQGRAF